MEHDAEEDEKQSGGQNASLLDAVGDGEAVRQRPIVLHRTFLAFMELEVDGEKCGETAKARKNFQRPITAVRIECLGQVKKTVYIFHQGKC